MADVLASLDGVVSQLVADQDAPTAESVRALISAMRVSPMFSEVSDEDAEKLARRLEERIGISMGLGAAVTDTDFKPWLSDAKANGLIDPYYWSRYKKLLQAKRLPSEVVTSTDFVTDRILDRMGNPSEAGTWERKGMVVGHVQSGKTANYTGLVCKAADAGYRLIIVIAGIHNNLRNQTQERIDEGFVGRDTGRLEKKDTREKPRTVGVGNFDDRKAPVSLTTTLRDFNKATATTNTSQIASYAVPVVLVIKKNSSTLANLIDWLKEHSAGRASEMVDQPMLLIDDEADNASIDIKYGKDEVSRINGQIRSLLGLFRRSCYVGYTATPFANIFIDPDSDDDVYRQDLFPRHFIIGLDAPTNYFGPRKVFVDGIPEEEGARPDYLRFITDNGDVLPVKHKIDHPVTELPCSMLDALRSFIVARVIRNLRGQKSQHASMLVNASRFTGIQNMLRNRLHEHLKIIEDAVRVDAAKDDAAERNLEIAALKECWQDEYSDAGVEWQQIQEGLLSVVSSAFVVAVNSASPEGLDYSAKRENGLTVIAVGGFSLSRGLTLEGLTVSYFLRNSLMYDTLMQMGRWFGYRGDYEDLCRIWMPEEAASWYAHIAEAVEELQAELKKMEQANATPEQFGLAVRSHPSALMVTARNKMGSGTKHVLVGLSNNFIETTKLNASGISLDKNRGARDRLLDALIQAGHTPETAIEGPGGFVLSAVPVSVVEDFLRDFDNERESVLTDTRPVRAYISDRRENELARWDIMIASRSRDPDNERVSLGGWSIVPLRRAVGGDDLARNVLSISGKRARVASRGMERAGLSDPVAHAAEDAYRKENGLGADSNVNFPDRIYRARRERPLLILFNLSIKEDKVDQAFIGKLPTQPVVGWAISFPVSNRPDQKVEYILNTTKLREMFGDEDEDEDYLDDRE
ncbi:Z1 domain-containing protein [Rhizorhabdus histidinilytica]|uniref:Z1 domain-containing protein n=1 Tax=Rhizorhabdus histidinilytica TaxID=439228 RepID=A0A1T5FQ61_9SPHN|nr:Z1 domain-containing protein [Rhizorhabdus histidinilytica]SKB98267.1 Z1 domain-containing protein [Rhizorhabdus histidinilytica]